MVKSKNLFSRIFGLISTKLDTKLPWVKKTHICSKKRPRFFTRRDNNEQQKYIDGLKKSSRELLVQIQFGPTLKIKNNCKII